MKFEPTLNRILIKPDPVDTTTKTGLILAETAANTAPTMGAVVAVGPGRTEGGVFIPTVCNVGDRVLWGKFVGSELMLEGERYLIMRDFDLVGILERASS